MESDKTEIQKQLLKYERGKHTIALLLNVIVLLGFLVELFNFYKVYTSSHLILQVVSILILFGMLIYFLLNKNKHFKATYLIVSYTVTINTLLNTFLFPDFASRTLFNSSEFFARDMIYFIAISAFIGFIASPKHILWQGLLTITFISLHLTLQGNPFIYANAPLYYIVTCGFALVMYYLMTNLNKFVEDLSNSNKEILSLQKLNNTKKTRLERFNQSIIDLSRKDYPETGLDDSMRLVFEEVVHRVKMELGCHRVGIWLFEEGQNVLVKKLLITDEGFNSEPIRMSRTEFPVYFSEIINNSSYISAPDATTHPLTHEFKNFYLDKFKIYSLLDCPIKANNKVLGVICCEHQNEIKNWEQEEIFFIQSVSDYVAIQLKNKETDTLLQNIRTKNEEILKSIAQMELVQKKLVEAKEGAERANKAKSEFLANMSHEIRTPLNAVLGFSDLLKGKTIEPKYEKYLDGILTGGRNLLSLINDILDLSKIEAGHIEIQNVPVDLRILLKELSEVFAQKGEIKGLSFEIKYTGIELPKLILLDETRIRQVLFNLLGNAFKFTHKGGVTLEVEAIPSVEKGKVHLFFKVIDTGIGIPQNQQAVIFESFKQQDSQSTRKYGGTGLGLTITKRLVEILKGKIELTSVAGKGSSFSIYLNDVSMVSTEKKNLALTDSNYIFKGQTLLLVEDNESNRDLILGYLSGADLQILWAENGKVALEMMKKTVPDIILLDMMMPVMDGYTTALVIRSDERYKQIPILALTASIVKHSENSIRDLCNDYLRKPISKSELLNVLSNYLDCDVLNTSEPLLSVEISSAMLENKELKSKLRESFLETWKENNEPIHIESLVIFARNLREFGMKHSSDKLVEYAESLLLHAEDFNISKMNAKYFEFVQFIE